MSNDRLSYRPTSMRLMPRTRPDQAAPTSLATTSKAVGRAFNSALAQQSGSMPIWLILNALKNEPRRTQLDLARAVGIEGPTLTRHLDGMEQAGLVKRQRGTLDRRTVQVELTPSRPRTARPAPEGRDQLQPTTQNRPQRRRREHTPQPASTTPRQRRRARSLHNLTTAPPRPNIVLSLHASVPELTVR